MKEKRELPKGITEWKGMYIGRFTYQKETYSVCDKNLRMCKKKLEDIRYEVKRGVYIKEKDILNKEDNSKHEMESLNEFFTEHILNKSDIRNTSKRNYDRTYKTYVQKQIGEKPLDKITKMDIDKLLTDLRDRGYAKATVECVRTLLSGIFKDAVRNEVLDKNVVALTKMPYYEFDENEQKVEFLSLSEEERFLDYCMKSEYDICNICFVGLSTGMRSGELRGLCWKEIDFEKRTIRINKSLGFYDKKYFLGEPKTQTSYRTIPMTERAFQALTRQKKEQEELKKLYGADYIICDGLDDLVFTQKDGRPLNRDILRKHIIKVVKLVRVDYPDFVNVRPHMLRHTFATRCIERGMNPKTLQKLLGHSKLQTTMDLYVHVDDDTMRNEMEKML